MQASTDLTDRFRDLHRAGCFVIPNPWDVGSAKLLVGLGFKALATTSSGSAWTLGKSDNRLALDEALAHLAAVASSVDVPVNADFEGGFAVEPDEVAQNVARAIETGIAGLSIEDSSGDPTEPLFDFGLSVARVQAARRAIDDRGGGVLLTGRCESYVVGRPDLAETIRRLRAYADAGADCLYAPRLGNLDDIAAIVGAVAPKPVNVLVGSDFTTVAALADLGVRRISVGGGLARVAWGAFLQAAAEIAKQGTFSGLNRGIAFAEIDGAFSGDDDFRS
ncbi:MAG: isocitrate lyase/phosphoenolpyruvate mutase family protein [Chloroflexota bacterium]|jgi:2-methylisocitrate lyase-like PEP mutase family enzyme|nr:isocitrate lyase/phosphoenolpyruvate mutase family protein [Chloroflexota bacterium]MDH5242857.1 isocitrate lyase/phosphoenolpyruvate mutase family protein [Chloroflexota bacterium]